MARELKRSHVLAAFILGGAAAGVTGGGLAVSAEAVTGEFADRRRCAARAHTSKYSSPTLGLGRATRAAMVGFKVRIRKM